MFKRRNNNGNSGEQTFEVTPDVLGSAREVLADYASVQPVGEPYVQVLQRAGRLVGAPSIKPDLVWERWLSVAQTAHSMGEYELAIQVFFFAYGVKQADLTFSTYDRIGFASPQLALKAITETAHASASASSADFAVQERSGEPPVPRAGLVAGTQSLLDQNSWY